MPSISIKTCCFILTLFVLQSCLKDKSSPCKQTKDYFYLDATAKSKVPYLKPEFDTLSFASNKGDTLVFVRQPKDSGYYCEGYFGNMDCGPDYDCYENYGAKYTCIKGNGSFEFKHGKKLFIKVKSNTRPDNSYFNMIEIHFNNNLHLIFCDCVTDDEVYKKYIRDTIINNINYKNVFYEFHEFDNFNIGKGYYNKDFGLLYIEDYSNNLNWTLIKP